MKRQLSLFALVFVLSAQLAPLYPIVLADNDAEFKVIGIVLSDEGTALSGVLISVFDSSSGSLVKQSNTDFNGYIDLWHLPAGSYNLVFEKPGYVTHTTSISSSETTINLGYVRMSKALQLSSTTVSRVASPGDKLLFSFTVSNRGEEVEVVNFEIAHPESWATRILDQLGEVTKIYLLPETTLPLQLEVRIPLTATETENISLLASGQTNSTLNFTITLESSENRLISCQFPGKASAPGETTLFQVRVTNPFGMEMRFQVTVASAPPGWTALVKSTGGEVVTELTLGSDEFADLIVEAYVPTEAPDGEYPVIFNVAVAAASEDLVLLVVVQKGTAGIGVDLEVIPPYLDAYADSQAKFDCKITNRGGYSQLFDLAVSGLSPELRTWFEGSDEQEITRVYVEAGGSQEFSVVVALPKAVPLGRLDFTVSVTSVSVSKSMGLTLNVLGFYELTVRNVNFYTRVSVGGETSYELWVRNTGTHELTNVRVNVTGSIPDGFRVEVEPMVIPALIPDGEEVFVITVTTQADVNAGNYYLDFEGQSDQIAARSFTLRIEVAQQMSRVFIGGLLVVIALLALFFVYRRFGRR